jgi:hypothetical protein
MNHLQQVEQNLIRGGHVPFWGSFGQQNPAAFLSINRLLNAHSFDTIVELGSHDFGTSTMFALYCYLSRRPAVCDNPNEPVLYKNRTHHRKPKHFYTFDNVIRDQAAASVMQHLGAGFYKADTLTDQVTIDAIRGLLSNPESGTVLLLCDGGNKKLEVELYGGSLKKGDFIMAHDWAYDAEAFERNKREGVWFSHETKWADTEGEGQQFGLKDSCEKYGIEPIYADEFDRVAWFAGRKS